MQLIDDIAFGFAFRPDPHASKACGRPWNSVETGPKRDIVGELTSAVRNRGMKMGLYYSLHEWFQLRGLEQTSMLQKNL